MKICWDNLEKLRYNKRTGRWYKGTNAYIYMDSCKYCNEPYLSTTKNKDDYCSRSCANTITSTKHGMVETSTYNSWEAMKQRCLNNKNKRYKNYNKEMLCKRWYKFVNFLEDMGERPDDCELHRKNNNKGYSPDNCEWINRILHREIHK